MKYFIYNDSLPSLHFSNLSAYIPLPTVPITYPENALNCRARQNHHDGRYVSILLLDEKHPHLHALRCRQQWTFTGKMEVSLQVSAKRLNNTLWTLVIRTKGLHFIRPDLKKSWRPIVTLVVDSQHHHEIVLGVDGQNPNLRAPFCLWVHAFSIPYSVFWRNLKWIHSARTQTSTRKSISMSGIVPKVKRRERNGPSSRQLAILWESCWKNRIRNPPIKELVSNISLQFRLIIHSFPVRPGSSPAVSITAETEEKEHENR